MSRGNQDDYDFDDVDEYEDDAIVERRDSLGQRDYRESRLGRREPLADRMHDDGTADGPKATPGLVLGGLSLVAWCIPLFGVPMSIAGIVMSAKALDGPESGSAKVGLGMSIAGIVLSLLNAVAGAIMAMNGNHPLVN